MRVSDFDRFEAKGHLGSVSKSHDVSYIVIYF
jgi:hypothetical protein